MDQIANAVPIYQAATFASADSGELGDILADRQPGYAYSRIENPTAAAMASAFAELEGAEAGFSFASGMAAIHAALVSLLRAGDRIVCTRAVYGSTRALMTSILTRFGVEVVFVDPVDPEAVEAALTPGTRVLYLETISNPTIIVADLADLIERAHRHGVTVVVDNTFASPYLCRPLELGADIVVESCTKWIGGPLGCHRGRRGRPPGARSNAVRAVEIDIGRDRGAVHGLPGAARHGNAARPDGAPLRQRAGHRALPGVAAGGPLRPLPGSREPPPGVRGAAGAAGRRGHAGRSTWASGRPPAAFLDALTIPIRTASLGSIQTIAVHPPSSTHRQLSDAELEAAGIPQGLVRISVGLEDAEDLIADVAAGLAAARTAITA